MIWRNLTFLSSGLPSVKAQTPLGFRLEPQKVTPKTVTECHNLLLSLCA